jgi:GNAT superfamily N-acetyltransferase
LIKAISTEETLKLRHEVLWPDKPLSYVRLPEDDEGYHYGAFPPSEALAVAVISLFLEDVPQNSSTSILEDFDQAHQLRGARFRKFACELSWQGRGIGTALLNHVMSVARTDLNVSVLWCDARLASAAWYEKRGMEKFGAIFYKGSVEYVRMKISLR